MKVMTSITDSKNMSELLEIDTSGNQLSTSLY